MTWLNFVGTGNLAPPRRGGRKRNTDKLTELLAAEKQDEHGNTIPVKASRTSKPRLAKSKAKSTEAVAVDASDEDDDDYNDLPALVEPSDSEGSDNELSDDSDDELDNEEVKISHI